MIEAAIEAVGVGVEPDVPVVTRPLRGAAHTRHPARGVEAPLRHEAPRGGVCPLRELLGPRRHALEVELAGVVREIARGQDERVETQLVHARYELRRFGETVPLAVDLERYALPGDRRVPERAAIGREGIAPVIDRAHG